MKSVLLPCLMGLAAVTGCVEDQTLSIQNYVLDDPASACVVTTTETTFLSRGLLDVGVVASTGAPGYVVFPLIRNNLQSSMTGGTPNPADIEHHTITVTGVNVQLKPDPSLAAAIPSNQRKFMLKAAGGVVTPQGEAVFGVEVIPRPVALELVNSLPDGVGNQLPTIIASISPIGDYGGSTVVGPAVDFPISVCKFCLTGPISTCPTGGFPAASVLAGGCSPAQDSNVTCCAASQNQVLCGSQVPVQTM